MTDFEGLVPERANGVLLDITDSLAIDAAARGLVDGSMNNASYGREGVLEESLRDELQ